jgi:hypothetical protein
MKSTRRINLADGRIFFVVMDSCPAETDALVPVAPGGFRQGLLELRRIYFSHVTGEYHESPVVSEFDSQFLTACGIRCD